MILLCIFFFKQKTAYEMRISDWSSDVCSSDLQQAIRLAADIAHAMGMPIKHRDIKKGALDNQQRAELKKVRERAKLLPVKFIPTGRVNVKRIISLAAQQKALCEAQGRTLDFVVVDYLGQIGRAHV